VRVVGSVARGKSTSDSDVDLLVDFPLDKSIFEMVGLWLDLQDLLGLDVSLLSDHDDLGERIRQNILHDAVPL
jgi:uncharacterized protein